MKSLRMILLFLLMSGLAVTKAAYLSRIPQTILQPDGSVLHCLASGDEYYHWLHDDLGYTIIQDTLTGFFVYADKNSSGLFPTGFVPGRVDPAYCGLQPGLKINPDDLRERYASRYKKHQLKSAETVSNTGTFNNLVIFIRFSNQNEFTESLAGYSRDFNATDQVSMTAYFREVSKNHLNISTTFYPLPTGTRIVSYQDSHMRRYYQPYNSSTNPDGYRTNSEYVSREMTLLRDAALSVKSQVEASGIDYDHDHDGYVDNVCFIIQGPTDGWSDLLWPHQWVLSSYDVRFNGARVYNFNFQLSEVLGVSVLCHEMFHSLGAPDLYRYENDDIVPVGPWDLMAHNTSPPQHMSAYMKMKYGKWFQEIPAITADGTYTLRPLSTDGYAAYKIPSPNSTQEFFVIEYRKAAGRFESGLVGSGLIISRINPSLEGNAQGPPDEVYVYRPNGTVRSNGTINQAIFSSNAGRTAFDDNSNPSCFLSNGNRGGIRISAIGAAGETISFTVGSGSVANPPRNLTASLDNRTVTLGWQQPEPGTSLLSGYKIYRNQSAIATLNNNTVTSYADRSVPNGTYQYHVTALYSNPAAESAASNTVSVTVGSGARPDLVVADPLADPVNVEPGGAVNLSCKIENKGDAAAGPSIIRIYLSRDEGYDSDDNLLASASTGQINAGSSAAVAKNPVMIPTWTGLGNWYVLFIADADGSVAESIEDNNTGIVPVSVGNPALAPPRNLAAGLSSGTVNLSWQEPEPGTGTLAYYSVYRDGVKITATGSPSTLSYADQGLPNGVYSYHVTAGYSSPAGESPPSNTVSVTVTMESRPDLTIQDFNVSPAEVTPGGSIDVSCVLLNLGGTASDETEIRLYLSLDEVIDAADHDLAYGSMDPLDPGGRVGVTGQDITLPTDLASGYWFALIEADSRHALDESNEGNNVASARLKVLGNGPDLTITNVSLFPAVILPGTNVRITFNVYNAGNVGASPVKAIFYLSGDEFLDPSDQNVADASTRILGAKTNSLMNCGFVPGHSIAGGQFYLIGMMDPDGVVKEIDEENNRYVKPVTIAGTSGTGGITMSEGIRVYPIPAHDRLIIELTDNSGREGSLVIRDLPGRTLFERDFKPGGLRKCEIDVTSWPRGTYLAYFSGGMTYGAARIVLQ